MPISWKGMLQQYAGRLHREHSDKKDVRIYDYIERDQPKLSRMWDKRERGYRAMGYRVRTQLNKSDSGCQIEPQLSPLPVSAVLPKLLLNRNYRNKK
jgi:superfamily II DNA or RNA helicase